MRLIFLWFGLILSLFLTACGKSNPTVPSATVEGAPFQSTPLSSEKTATGFYWPTGTNDLGNYYGYMGSGCWQGFSML